MKTPATKTGMGGHGGRGFTAVELIVAITILTLMLTAMSYIWSTQRNIVAISSAQTEVAPYARAIESNLRRDLNGLTHDGFMVIRSANANGAVAGEPNHTYTYDQLMFFSNGLKNTAGYSGSTALTSRVWYGHMATAAWGTPTAATPASGELPWKMSLGRQDLLLQPGTPVGVVNPMPPANIFDPSIANGTIDYATTGLLATKVYIFSQPTPAAIMANACFRVQGQRYIDANQIAQSTGLMPVHALLAPYCSSFRVQFAGRYDAATPVGQVDVVDRAGGNFNVKWYGLGEDGVMNTPAIPAGLNTQIDPAGTPGGTHAIVFSPEQPELWPTMIAITLDLHDSNGRYHERFKKRPFDNSGMTSPDHQSVDGYQYRFIVKF